MKDAILTVGAIVIMFIIAPFLILRVRDMIFCCKSTKEGIKKDQESFKERLLNPDLQFLENHFACKFPASIKSLYADKKELLRVNFDVVSPLPVPNGTTWHIEYYEPADTKSLNKTWPGLEKYFIFANDGFGNQYCIEPQLPDPPVLFYDHEGGSIIKVCDRISDFMQQVKR